MSSQAILKKIIVYPIKSLMGVEVEETDVFSSGLAFDRQWFLIDEDQKIVSQNRFPKLCSLGLSLDKTGVRVFAGRENTILIPYKPIDKRKHLVQIKNQYHEGLMVANEINEFFSDFLGISCKLLFQEKSKDVKKDIGTFNHGHPFLLLSEASLEDLNSRLETPVGMSSFRPNLIIGNCTEFAEDTLDKFKIGNVLFNNQAACARCKMSNINQKTGILRLDKEPLKTLATYRRIKDNDGVCFGRYLSTLESGVLRKGDLVIF